MKASINIALRKVKNSKGKMPVVLRITKYRISKIITLKLEAYEEEWNFKKNEFKRKAPGSFNKNEILSEQKDKARAIIRGFLEKDIDFTLNQFERKFRGFNNQKITVFKYLKKVIETKEILENYGASEPYRNLKSSLHKFAKPTIMFNDINYEFLQRFEIFLRQRGNSEGGIAFKMRHLRAIYNQAINKDLVASSSYPFKKYKISKLKGEKNKIALTREELLKFKNVDLSKHMNLVKSHYLFMFSFYSRGMNWVDMMELKWKDIYDGKIHYTRKKTKQRFVIEVTESLNRILDYFKNNYSNTSYVFPILLREGLTEKQKGDRNKKALKAFNKDLKVLAELADISKHITSYVARHTYATYLYNKGVSIEIISASMGHSSVLVTMSYLKEFEDSVLDEANRIELD